MQISDSLTAVAVSIGACNVRLEPAGPTCCRLNSKNPKVFGYTSLRRHRLPVTQRVRWFRSHLRPEPLPSQPLCTTHRFVVVIQGGTDALRLRCILKPKAFLQALAFAGQLHRWTFAGKIWNFWDETSAEKQTWNTVNRHDFYHRPVLKRFVPSRSTLHFATADFVS